jgi:hypothetical protein
MNGTLQGAGMMAHKESRSAVKRWLSRPWWAGLEVILVAVLAVIGSLLTPGGSTSFSNDHGNCVAQGNNTINCASASSGVNP